MVSVFRYAIHILCLGLLLACSLNQFPDSTIANGIYSSHKIELVEIENDRSAHWLKADLLVLPEFNPDYSYDLVRSDNQESLALVQDERLNWHQNFPHLNDFQAFKITLTKDEARNWLKALPFVVVKNKDEQVVKVSYAQTGFVLDDLYTGSGNDADEINDLGAVVDSDGVSFKLWAPTAENVTVLLFDKNKNPAAQRSLQMIEDPQTGVWSALGDSSLEFAYYQYQIRLFHYVTGNLESLVTTDPYSLSLSTNSEYSQVIDLDNKDTKPAGWDNQAIPTVKNPEDNIFYEVHIRDFSSADTSLSDATRRGKYKAFSERESAGIKHLKSLRASGLNNIHLLPTFDIGTVEEDQANVIDLHDPLAKVCQIASAISICQNSFDKNTTLYELLKSFDPLSEKAQALITEVKQFDNYNWGYDPYHYTVPEGSYALNPEGQARIVEFREMVQTLHELGFRVIMDVVYNHTHQAGLDQKSVLDKIVPGYYHRLHPVTGAIEQSTCCDNTATERRMMAKLMTDSLRVWADNYKIDGFRFDLMGHQPKDLMLTARDAVREVDPDTYFYGEGWDFGEVANNQRFVQASQLELGGSEIGTFSDRMRDAVRGCCFNSEGSEIRRQQGIGNG
ncbi:MAG: pullulanase-type alpha-1,6-glucosidase, partial [Gammaproteobacteria bacterium]|nr:pullulanase-type alpha-1,6-glucosidase [Gammaproteobacteria bacterium]